MANVITFAALTKKGEAMPPAPRPIHLLNIGHQINNLRDSDCPGPELIFHGILIWGKDKCSILFNPTHIPGCVKLTKPRRIAWKKVPL
jgi:hypothetical protein